MGRWLSSVRSEGEPEQKKSETPIRHTDKTDKTHSRGISSVLSVPQLATSEISLASPDADFLAAIKTIWPAARMLDDGEDVPGDWLVLVEVPEPDDAAIAAEAAAMDAVEALFQSELKLLSEANSRAYSNRTPWKLKS
jgi:hypothetical protein